MRIEEYNRNLVQEPKLNPTHEKNTTLIILSYHINNL